MPGASRSVARARAARRVLQADGDKCSSWTFKREISSWSSRYTQTLGELQDGHHRELERVL